MAVVSCPLCGSQLDLADQYLGREVRCGGCDGTFVAKADRPTEPADRPAPDFSPAAVWPPVEPPEERPPAPRFRRRDDDDRPSRRRYDDDDRPRSRNRRGYARDQLSSPASALQFVGWFGFFGVVMNLIAGVVMIVILVADPPGNGGAAGGGPDEQELLVNGVVSLVSAVVLAVISWVILTGANKMKRLEGYTYAVAASILALIPCFSPCCLIGLPYGIIALIALNDPDVRDAFDDRHAYPD